MATSAEDKQNPCDCHDENHGHEGGAKHKHVGDDCVHDDGSRHKIHQR